jgi:hypothetical protein
VRIDHVIHGTADLDVAAARVKADLGLTAVAGGRHDGLGTHNRIVPLGDGSFLELLAIADPQEARGSELGAALLAGIARGDGLLGWAVAVDDLLPGGRPYPVYGFCSRMPLTAVEISSASRTSAMIPICSSQTSSSTRLRNSSSSA